MAGLKGKQVRILCGAAAVKVRIRVYATVGVYADGKER